MYSCVRPDIHTDYLNVIYVCYVVSSIYIPCKSCQTCLEISLFFMDPHQGLAGRRSPITCWEVEGSQHEIVKLLLAYWAGQPDVCLLLIHRDRTDLGEESEWSGPQPGGPALWVVQDRNLTLYLVLCLQHLLGICWVLNCIEWMDQLISYWMSTILSSFVENSNLLSRTLDTTGGCYSNKGKGPSSVY